MLCYDKRGYTYTLLRQAILALHYDKPVYTCTLKTGYTSASLKQAITSFRQELLIEVANASSGHLLHSDGPPENWGCGGRAVGEEAKSEFFIRICSSILFAFSSIFFVKRTETGAAGCRRSKDLSVQYLSGFFHDVQVYFKTFTLRVRLDWCRGVWWGNKDRIVSTQPDVIRLPNAEVWDAFDELWELDVWRPKLVEWGQTLLVVCLKLRIFLNFSLNF